MDGYFYRSCKLWTYIVVGKDANDLRADKPRNGSSCIGQTQHGTWNKTIKNPDHAFRAQTDMCFSSAQHVQHLQSMWNTH